MCQPFWSRAYINISPMHVNVFVGMIQYGDSVSDCEMLEPPTTTQTHSPYSHLIHFPCLCSHSPVISNYCVSCVASVNPQSWLCASSCWWQVHRREFLENNIEKRHIINITCTFFIIIMWNVCVFTGLKDYDADAWVYLSLTLCLSRSSSSSEAAGVGQQSASCYSKK